MSERLEEVHKNATGIYSVINEQVDSVDLPIKDYNWLYEQAERAEELEEELMTAHAPIGHLEQENERLREALKNIHNVGHSYDWGMQSSYTPQGYIYREAHHALEEGNNEPNNI